MRLSVTGRGRVVMAILLFTVAPPVLFLVLTCCTCRVDAHCYVVSLVRMMMMTMMMVASKRFSVVYVCVGGVCGGLF